MKTIRTPFRWALVLFFAQAIAASAITFQTDTFIGVTDLSDDGQDIVVTNCTLTVDGAHGFNSLQVLNGGVVTHSPFIYGPQEITFLVTDEAQALSALSPATLDNTNVDTSTIMVTDPSLSIVYTEGVDYTVTASNQFIQLQLTTNSAVAEGATVFVSYEWAQEFQGFNLVVSNNVDVAPGGAIDLSGKGYAGGNGFGAGVGTSHSTNYPFTFTAGGGGGHGGSGGMSSTSARGGASYDSATNPGILGSGGGTGSNLGGAGGGLGQLSIGGALQVDGQILADGLKGTNMHSGGGSGGSFLLSAQTFSGAGMISARGGAGDTPDGGGGGGGRIAIYFGANNFSGNILAFGGAGASYGGAGTIFMESPSNAAGQLLIVNGGTRGTNTSFSVAGVTNLVISGGAIAQPQLSTFSVSNLFVGSNSWLIAQDATPLTISVNGDATVESNGVINADSKSTSGPGQGSASCNWGGSYGGLGGAGLCFSPGGLSYGSISTPSNLGSPGGGGASARGGGLLNLTVSGTLSLNGKLSANGASSTIAAGGGGSGGSVFLTAGTFAGGGTISANGGSANNLVGGGGGGGRIAVYFDTNLFGGSLSAHGGTGVNAGGGGTVYVKTNSSAFAQLTIDNAGLTGLTTLPSTLFSLDLAISGGAIVTNFDGSTAALRNLFIGSNSWFTINPSSSALLTINATNVTIQPGGRITTDGESTSGSGSGQTLNSTGGGGGNGGFGGASATNAAGGFSVGSLLQPASGGFGGNGLNGLGGNGGGAVTLNVASTLQLDGSISANGNAGPAINSGGGAGGGVSISAATFAGAGTISVNGGAANNLIGGGGGGGRVLVRYNTNLFTGVITGHGGSGANYGGAGTIYLARMIQLSQQIIVDNGGTPGAVTPLSVVTGPPAGPFDITVTGGAVVSNIQESSFTIGNFFIGSNSVFLPSPQTGFLPPTVDELTVSNLTIQAGGAIKLDGFSSGGVSPGQTLNLTGGGGSYGGLGGASISNAAGGLFSSDSIGSPSSGGSRGGSGVNQGAGGNGGGSLRLTTRGKLQLDGKISAEGVTSPSQNSGGGSGGLITISTTTFAGSGTVSVNGGAANSLGGGGGGGRISVSYTSNLFTGKFTAYGGAGANFGGAGTIYLASGVLLQPQAAQLIVDNGGAVGNTPLSGYPSGNFSLTVTGGAILLNTNSVSTLTLQNLLIGSNSTFVASPLSSQTITVLTNATIQAGGKFTDDGASTTTGGQTLNLTGGGGGHGGYGGASLSNALGGNIITDPITQPTSAGNRGGSGFTGVGGNGGGAVHLTVNGTLQLDGRMSADGLTSPAANAGGGSGGAIWLTAGKLSGAGVISASGGAGNNAGGGGGGGRLAITASTNLFAGNFTARGGAGGNYGGAGTIYSSFGKSTGPQTNQLIVDNGGTRGTNTLLSGTPAALDVFLNSGAAVTLPSGALNWKSLTIASNATLGSSGNGSSLVLTITSNLTVQPGGAIMLDGQGFAANAGNGRGTVNSSSGGGGGHGGYGSMGSQLNTGGGLSYDSVLSPTQAGSGGGSQAFTSGSAGGGAFQLTVSGTLNVGGTITANGMAANTNGAGGGSGGSLWLNAKTLSGAGKISADGGDGDIFTSGGGGGGRIAVYFSTNAFTGTYSAHGGAGFLLYGGAGTIYIKTNSSNFAALVLDNAGEPGTNTSLTTLGTSSAMLSVQNGAAAITTAPLTLQTLSIGPGAFFDASSQAALTLNVVGDAVIAAGGAIDADAAGFNPLAGSGAGTVDFLGDGSGGGYGGAGGASLFGAPGGGIYGSSNQPVTFGSPGGVSPALSGFSQGGGAIHLTVSGTLTLNGNISADGNDGIIDGSGGGSGGSIWITTKNFFGSGFLTANGGMGESDEGGGGGGGRIAVYAGTNLFSGSVFASGGGGASAGQDGTIYIPTSLLISGLVADSNGVAMAAITLQPGGMTSVMTDTNGFYSVTVPPFWAGTITPMGNAIFIPSSRTYANVLSSMPSQNFLVASPSDFNFSGGQFDGTNVNFNWYGINGVTYQPYYSTNLVDWVPYGSPFVGGNAPATITCPVTNAPQMFFRMGASY